MEIITLQYASGESVPIELTRKNMKHMRMRVLPGGRVLLSAPLLSPRARIDAFIESHRDWIYTHHFEGEKRLGYIEMSFLPSDGMVYYLGVPRRLRTMPTIRDEVLVFPDEIIVRHKRGAERVEKVYMEYLTAAAMELFTKRMEYFLPVFIKCGARRPTLKVKRFRAKWGVCDPTRGEITLNLHLIKADLKYIDYVIVHEMTHLLYRGHGKGFYSFLLRVMPDARERKKELNKCIVVDG